jgi:hypothetical protein
MHEGEPGEYYEEDEEAYPTVEDEDFIMDADYIPPPTKVEEGGLGAVLCREEGATLL